ncbi:MAG TPA: hypothetical protein VGK45_17390 [Thermoanaerobaculia bacterium]
MLANTEVYLLDASLRPVPLGSSGEVLRGVRIELGEIEAVLRSSPAVVQVVAVVPGQRLRGA